MGVCWAAGAGEPAPAGAAGVAVVSGGVVFEPPLPPPEDFFLDSGFNFFFEELYTPCK